MKFAAPLLVRNRKRTFHFEMIRISACFSPLIGQLPELKIYGDYIRYIGNYQESHKVFLGN
jgi:hypothetical protein